MAFKRDESFDAFFREVFPRAVRVAERVLPVRAAAEDVAAEAMARAYADWRNIAGLAYRDAWVLRVTSNLALDAARRRKPDVQPWAPPDVQEEVTDRVARLRWKGDGRRSRDYGAVRETARRIRRRA